MMDGRVKTLHPIIHGGLLARARRRRRTPRRWPSTASPAIDLLAVNLYPFEQTVAGGADSTTAIENIDIGGPAMIRAAAKNHDYVAVCIDPADYAAVLAEMDANGGATTLALRKTLAARAFARTAAYDAAISGWFAGAARREHARRRAPSPARWPRPCAMARTRISAAAFYRTGDARSGVATARQLQGKELSYNNLNDTDAAFELVAEFDPKAMRGRRHHQARQSLRRGDSARRWPRPTARRWPAIRSARSAASSPLNRPLDAEAAREIVKIFTEVIIAPDAERRGEGDLRRRRRICACC